MIRQEIIKRSRHDVIKWRSNEVMRIEAFSDAVFAFSLTLLIVSLEVPETFEQLTNAMKGFFPFAVCFLLLFQIWYSQFIFFRRYGLQNLYSIILNALLLFVVLFYMYPLKFLFNLWIPGGRHSVPAGEIIITQEQIPELMLIYGSGFISIYIIFILLYRYAVKCKDEIGLDDRELFVTNTKLYAYYILLFIGILSVTIAYFSDPSNAGYSGLIYMLIGPALTIHYSMRGKIFRKKFQPV